MGSINFSPKILLLLAVGASLVFAGCLFTDPAGSPSKVNAIDQRIVDQANATGDYSVCFTTFQDLQGDCLQTLCRQRNDFDAAKAFYQLISQNSTMANPKIYSIYCGQVLAKSGVRDASLCSYFDDNYSRFTCYNQLARITNDSVFCSYANTELFRQECIYSLASANRYANSNSASRPKTTPTPPQRQVYPTATADILVEQPTTDIYPTATAEFPTFANTNWVAVELELANYVVSADATPTFFIDFNRGNYTSQWALVNGAYLSPANFSPSDIHFFVNPSHIQPVSCTEKATKTFHLFEDGGYEAIESCGDFSAFVTVCKNSQRSKQAYCLYLSPTQESDAVNQCEIRCK